MMGNVNVNEVFKIDTNTKAQRQEDTKFSGVRQISQLVFNNYQEMSPLAALGQQDEERGGAGKSVVHRAD
ncbi:hypothetical protein AGMMS50239_14330 [Bacteroidia bacterium]|nr:hypothetical protein AGMMS50239_14330 [Bacteroidia bacterium]